MICNSEELKKLKNLNKLVGKKFKHFKGNLYKVIAIAIDTETKEFRVIYQNVNKGDELWDRPAKMFSEELSDSQKEAYGQVYRFEEIQEGM